MLEKERARACLRVARKKLTRKMIMCFFFGICIFCVFQSAIQYSTNSSQFMLWINNLCVQSYNVFPTLTCCNLHLVSSTGANEYRNEQNVSLLSGAFFFVKRNMLEIHMNSLAHDVVRQMCKLHPLPWLQESIQVFARR